MPVITQSPEGKYTKGQSRMGLLEGTRAHAARCHHRRLDALR